MSDSTLSVQLYTVRELLTDDIVGTLKRIADLGFSQVEPFAFLSFGDDLRRGLAETGLSAPTTHQSFIGGDLEPVFEAASALGIGTVIDPFVAPDRWQTAESVDEIAAQLNAAAEVAAATTASASATTTTPTSWRARSTAITALEYFADKLAPEVVLEVDTYWVTVGGHDRWSCSAGWATAWSRSTSRTAPAPRTTKDQVAVGQGRSRSCGHHRRGAEGPARHRTRRLARRPLRGCRGQLRLPHRKGTRA